MRCLRKDLSAWCLETGSMPLRSQTAMQNLSHALLSTRLSRTHAGCYAVFGAIAWQQKAITRKRLQGQCPCTLLNFSIAAQLKSDHIHSWDIRRDRSFFLKSECTLQQQHHRMACPITDLPLGIQVFDFGCYAILE